MNSELKNNWNNALSKTFPTGAPTQATWTRPKEIASILKALGSPNAGHMFLPDGGGQDLTGAKLAEGGLVELYSGDPETHAYLMSAESLEFHATTENSLGFHFMLNLKPTRDEPDFPESSAGFREEYGEHQGEKYTFNELMSGHDRYESALPKNTRRIQHYWNGGKIAIFAKAAPYNNSQLMLKIFGTDSYDALHMDQDKFKLVTTEIAKEL